MSLQTRANRKAPPIDSWEDELNSVLRDPARSVRFSEESVRRDVRRHPVRADDGIYAQVSLHYPPGNGSRIQIPVRAQNCTHLQCFDLAAYLKAHDRKLLAVKRIVNGLGVDPGVDKKYIYWFCPICKAQAGVRDLHVDGYFDSLLQEYKDLQKVEEVEIMSDGSHRPIVRPKVEVFPVSDSPVVPSDEGEAEKHVDEKPLPASHLENADEVLVSADAMEITDLSIEEIQRLPETHQLCKAVKRRLLDKFKHAAKMEVVKENPSNAAFATSTHTAGELGSSGADDAQLLSDGADDTALSSGDASEQAQTVQTEVEQLRIALADANNAKLVLHAQNEQLQADLLASQNAAAANEQEKAQLRLEKRRLETEKTALHFKLESDASLVAEREQLSTLAEKKAQKLQLENDKLREALADKERASLDQWEQLNQLESNLREKQTAVDVVDQWSQLCVVKEGLVADNANLRRRITELEASVSSSGKGKRQATEECDGVSAKRGNTETSENIQPLLQGVPFTDRTMREWFFKNVLLSHEFIFKALVDTPVRETRESFNRVLFHFLQKACEDDLSKVDLSSMANGTFFRDDRTITDSVLRLITLVPRNHFNDFLRQPQQFLDLAMSWVKESLDNRKRFINVGGLSILLTVIAREEDHRTRSLCCKFPVIFDIVYFLLAACCIAPEQEASASAAVTRDARNVFVFAPPREVHEWITDADNEQRLIRMLLHYAYEKSTVRNTICMLCRDNMVTTKRVFAHLHSKRLMMLLEQRKFLYAFRKLMVLRDSYQPQRIVLGVRGSFMQDFLGMRYRHTQPGKAVQLLDEFTLMYEGELAVKDVLSKDNDFATAFHEMTEWLSRQVDAKDHREPSSRFDNVDDDDWTVVIDKEQAVEVFGRCKLICDHLRRAGSLQLMQEPTEVTDTEKDEDVQMDDVADANRSATTAKYR